MDHSFPLRMAVPSLLALALAGCAAAGAGHAHGGRGDGYDGGMGAHAGGMDMQAMCEMHRNMAGRSQAERQAMLDEHMRNMSPQMRQQMQERMESCR